MTLKVTITTDKKGNLCLADGRECSLLNPKELMLYSGALCASMTLKQVLLRERLEPRSFELSVSGELSTRELKAESTFTEFDFLYRLESSTLDEHAKLSAAVKLAHDEWCGLVKMLRKIAPVTREISIVSIGS